MKKIVFDKSELIDDLKKEIENLEKTEEEEIDYHKVSKNLIDEESVLETLKELNTKKIVILDMEFQELIMRI